VIRLITVSVNDIFVQNLIGQEVTIRGWVYRRRKAGKIHFLLIRNRGAILQCVFEEERVGTQLFKEARRATIESSVELQGIIKKEPRSPGGLELEGTSIKIIGLSETFPITRDQSVSFLLDNRHLWLRSRRLTSIMQVKAKIFETARDWFKKHDYIEVQCPLFITAAVEGGATLFKMKYFNTEAYLTQSSQFYLETLIYSLDKVYTIAPSFRAEKSRTIRHLTEFWMLEAEIPFIDMVQNMDIQEALLVSICNSIAQTMNAELKFLGRDPSELTFKEPLERISYTEAIDELQKAGSQIEWGQDLGSEDERILTVNRKTPLFVYNYPTEAKAFYHKLDPSNPKIVNCADCLAPEGHGEIIGGGQRIHALQELLQRINDANLTPKDYEWYIDLRKYGTIPHAGFGLGMERLVKWICKLDSIRDTIAYPRDMRRIYP